MKIAPRQIEQFIKNPDAKFMVILVYGPDEGLVRERVKILSKTVVEDLSDPFNVAELTADGLNENPAQLMDEISSMSMMGGRRLIRIADASDKIADSVTDVLKNAPTTDNVAIIAAGDLKPTSKLRKICEKQDNAAAVACYAEDARDIGRIIMQKFKDTGLTITPDAMQSLTAKITGDRAIAMQAAEKIITYIGQDRTEITIDDIIACTEDTSTMFINDLTKNTLSGNIKESGLLLERLLQEGIPPVAICRSFQNRLHLISLIKAHIADGKPVKSAITQIRPPIFFKEHDAFIKHVNMWSMPVINTLIKQFMDTEAMCKTTDAPDKILCDRLIFKVATMGKKLNRKY